MQAEAPYALTLEQREFFIANGYVGPFRVYDPDEAKALWKKMRPHVHDRSKAIYPNDPIDYDRHFDVPQLRLHVSRPQIVQKLQSLIGPDVLCWRSEFFPKYPGDAGTEWHQVESFAYASGIPQLVPTVRRHETPTELTVWTALSDVTTETACMKFMPGSHKRWFYDEKRQMKQFHGRTADSPFFGYSYDELKLDPNWTPDESQAAYVTMNAGEAVIFTARCMHGSLPIKSPRTMRIAVSSRYVSTDVRIYPDQMKINEHGAILDLSGWGAVLVAGVDEHALNRIRMTNVHGEPFVTRPRVKDLRPAKICFGADQWAPE